ncbi:MAG: glycosyltransferase family 2 protein [Terriglobales bacterium]
MISIVVPVYNEEEIIPQLHEAVADAVKDIGEDWEVVYVNDGSQDSSLNMLRDQQAYDPHIVVVNLSRNFGHMGALAAGLQTAVGDAIVLMDADLQDPPSVIPEFVRAWREGAQVVAGVRRTRQEGRKVLAILFPIFYRVLGALSDFPIPLDSGIFGLLDRKAVDSINGLRERNRYLPGLRAWVGYSTAIVYYDRQDRIGGEGKLTFLSRIKYAMDAITSFSYKPLRLSFVLSGLALTAAVILTIVALASGAPTVTLTSGISATVCLVGSLMLLSLGLLGEYMGRVYDEVRSRPLSIVNDVYRATHVRQRVLETWQKDGRRSATPAA